MVVVLVVVGVGVGVVVMAPKRRRRDGGGARGSGTAEPVSMCEVWSDPDLHSHRGVELGDRVLVMQRDGVPTFVGTDLRACKRCRLILTVQYLETEQACPNCGDLGEEWELATAGGLDYEGCITVLNPAVSAVASIIGVRGMLLLLLLLLLL